MSYRSYLNYIYFGANNIQLTMQYQRGRTVFLQKDQFCRHLRFKMTKTMRNKQN